MGRFTPDRREAAVAHAQTLHDAGRPVLVQSYLGKVEHVGEAALVYVDGRFTHAITKGAMIADGVAHPVLGDSLYVEENIAPRHPSEAERAVGTAVTDYVRDRFGADPLYARVDLLPGPDGPVVVELELVEPSLFLNYAAEGRAADALAAAIEARA